MTEPTDLPGKGPEAAAPEAAAAEAAEPAAPSAAPPAPFTPIPPFVGQPYPPAYPAPYPFAPVAKEPWFNPAKKTSILVTSIVLALVLLGGGIVIGAVSANHGGRARQVMLYGPRGAQGVGPANGPRFRLGGPGAGFGRKGQVAPTPSATPTTS